MMETTKAAQAGASRGAAGQMNLRLAQIVVAVAGIFNLLTGVALLFAPVWFFQHIGTFGPYNRHYEGDLGAFLLALGLGLLFAARSPSRYGLVVWVGAMGSLIHACNHIYDAVIAGASLGDWLAQPVPLFVLAFLLIWAASQGMSGKAAPAG